MEDFKDFFNDVEGAFWNVAELAADWAPDSEEGDDDYVEEFQETLDGAEDRFKKAAAGLRELAGKLGTESGIPAARLEEIIVNAMNWGLDHGETITRGLVRGSGITADELDKLGYGSDGFTAMRSYVGGE